MVLQNDELILFVETKQSNTKDLDNVVLLIATSLLGKGIMCNQINLSFLTFFFYLKKCTTTLFFMYFVVVLENGNKLKFKAVYHYNEIPQLSVFRCTLVTL